jgi:hypothetical protein
MKQINRNGTILLYKLQNEVFIYKLSVMSKWVNNVELRTLLTSEK